VYSSVVRGRRLGALLVPLGGAGYDRSALRWLEEWGMRTRLASSEADASTPTNARTERPCPCTERTTVRQEKKQSMSKSLCAEWISEGWRRRR
jgi:hypothetical protein